MKVAIFLFLMMSEAANASYRVYRLRIFHFNRRHRVERVQRVTTTLDPYQWDSYYGLFGVVRVQMLDTWYCPGDTSRRGYCPRPKIPPWRGTASTDPKRAYLPYNYQPVIP